jgi:hypothetical protein
MVNLTPVVTDGNQWHTYAPGATFQIQVSVQGTLPSLPVKCYWINESKARISAEFTVTNTPQSLTSPSTMPGWYGIVFVCADPLVAFVPQDAGHPSSVFGFAVIPPPPTGAISSVAKVECPFGMIQGNIGDANFRHGSGKKVTGIHLKTKTWAQSTSSWSGDITAISNAGHTEMPLINNSPWDTSNSSLVSGTQLNSIASQFQAKLSADPNRVRYWQAGVEENGGSPYVSQHYFANLVAKVSRLKQVASGTPITGPTQDSSPVKFVYNTRGFDLPEFRLLFASQAFSVIDILSQNPYRWNNFATPEGWLANHIKDLRSGLDARGHQNIALWFGELGLPARGNTNPSGFFGYPSSNTNLPGVSMDYYANYVVKTHMIALANGIKRIYWYNYRNRDNDIHYAEDWFGMRSYISGQPGFPFPGYVAYITMLKHLKTCTFIKERKPVANMFAYEFQTEDLKGRLVVWRNASGSTTIPLTSLKPGLVASGVLSVENIYGKTVAAISGQSLIVENKPLFIDVDV